MPTFTQLFMLEKWQEKTVGFDGHPIKFISEILNAVLKRPIALTGVGGFCYKQGGNQYY